MSESVRESDVHWTGEVVPYVVVQVFVVTRVGLLNVSCRQTRPFMCRFTLDWNLISEWGDPDREESTS